MVTLLRDQEKGSEADHIPVIFRVNLIPFTAIRKALCFPIALHKDITED